MGTHQFCLKWNNYHSNLLDVFEQLLISQALVDVTLACEGFTLKAHKMVLSACSPFFHNLFLENPCKHPIVILKDMKYADLKAIINFMYRGEVNVAEGQLAALLKAAETLKVKGLAESTSDGKSGSPMSFSTSADHLSTMSQSGFSLDQAMQRQNDSPKVRRRKKLRVRQRPHSPSNLSGSDDQASSKGQETSEEMDESDSGEVKRKLKDALLRRLSTNPGSELQETSQNGTNTLIMSHINQSDSSPKEIQDNTSGDVDNLPQEVDVEDDVSQTLEKSMIGESVTLLSEGQEQNHTSILARQLSLPPGIMTARPLLDAQPHTSKSQSETFTSSGQMSGMELCPIETLQDSDVDVKPVVTFEESPSQLSLKFQPENTQSNNSLMSLYLDNPQIGLLAGGSEFQLDNQQTSSNQVLRGLLDASAHGDANLAMYPKVVCSVCDKIFNSSSSMRRHMREQHCPDASMNFVCDRCDKVFRRKEHLLLHTKRHH